ncbi:MAG: hypothetical protein A2X08_15345 [Bacteroidetes bacterium GWA2_32_17]|nr:MAG: hypothetical protein A2X08_15345 [Bacteroidetes bacterium GWA2_32_17]
MENKRIQSIEPEKGNENVQNEIPFNPNEISINIIPRTIGQLVEKLEDNQILIPKFQRIPNLWDIKKKSRFIESLMLNLPIPLFYFDENSDDKNIWSVIDGLQRMSTLEHFILSGKNEKLVSISGKKNSFRLEKLEFKTEFNGCSWEDLPRDMQRRINSNQVTINLIGRGTPEQVKFNIYSRINQGGIELKPQEIRTALFQGYRIEFIEKFVTNDTEYGKSFLKATDNCVPTKRQEDFDFVTRFLSFYLVGYKNYEPDMDSFLTKGTKEIPRSESQQQQILNSFKIAMNLAFEIFEKETFRKFKHDKKFRNPLNKALFEIISVYFAKLSDAERNILLKNRKQFIENFYNLHNDTKFFAAITSGTATKESVFKRHEEFQKILDQIIK